MVAVSWFGLWLRWRGKLEDTRWFLWVATGYVSPAVPAEIRRAKIAILGLEAAP
jgi:cytochrome bd-type quinol oxidase subunit 1